MQILVLGNSDTAGVMVDGPTWMERVRAAPETGAGPTTLTSVPFAPIGANAAGYAARQIARHEPDIFLVPIGTYAFTVGFVSKRIERLFGQRVASRYRRLERGFESRTRGRGSVHMAINGWARAMARRVIGTAPLASADGVSGIYEAVFERLASIKEAIVVVVTYSEESGLGRRALADREHCFARLRRSAERHHFTWVDGSAAMAGLGLDEPPVTPDGFHLTSHGHIAMAQAVTGVIAAARIRAAGVGQ